MSTDAPAPPEHRVAYIAVRPEDGPPPEPGSAGPPGANPKLLIPGLGTVVFFQDARRGERWGWTFRPWATGPPAAHQTAADAEAEARATLAAKLRAAADALDAGPIDG